MFDGDQTRFVYDQPKKKKVVYKGKKTPKQMSSKAYYYPMYYVPEYKYRYPYKKKNIFKMNEKKIRIN